ncbi:MAG TPA: ThiF family adenylyltransferase [Candidatus Chromulinivoraceae bacterium]|nr:ThiF family adenylyltransferase [Candidatus Chromulinivoraceae bacterium]
MGQGRLTEADHSQEWPDQLKRLSKKARHDGESWQPVVVEMRTTDAAKRLDALLESYDIRQIIDNYDEQYAELIVSRQPQLYQSSLEVKRESLKEYLEKHFDGRQSWQLGSWVYYPWNGDLVHILEKELFLESRTIRNKDLINEQEQHEYANFTVGCAGMSVGSNVAQSLAISGGSQKIKLVDGAVISASNLNRITTGVYDVGSSKSLVIARKLYEMNPYMEIERSDQNITEKNVADFFEQPWPLRAVVDEIDDLKIKILLRIEARKRGLPVIMATDLGDDVMLDVERFDLDRILPLFHGLVPNVEELLTKEVSKREWLKYATSIIGPHNTPLRMQQSLLKVGTKLVTQPQLGPTAMMSGVVVAYAIRQIATEEKLRSGRTLISLDKHLRPDLVTLRYRREHRKHTQQLKRALKAM